MPTLPTSQIYFIAIFAISVRFRVSEQQGAELDVTDDSESGASEPADPARLKLNRTENRHIPAIAGPPG
jgi:hypothetical protein